MEAIFKKALGWYTELPLWKKIVGCLFLVVLLVLGILYVVYRIFGGQIIPAHRTESDEAHNMVVNSVVAHSKAEQKKLEEDLAIKRSEAIILTNQRIKDEKKNIEVKDAILAANSFEEVDHIIKRLSE